MQDLGGVIMTRKKKLQWIMFVIAVVWLVFLMAISILENDYHVHSSWCIMSQNSFNWIVFGWWLFSNSIWAIGFVWKEISEHRFPREDSHGA